MLYDQIKGSLKEAMLAKDKTRLETIRAIVANFTNFLISNNRKPDDKLTDDEVLEVILRLSKQRKDSIEQYKKGDRGDLVKEEEAQLKILETYLPKMMERSEVERIVKSKKEELAISDPGKRGMLMSAVMKDLKGKAEGSLVKEVVDSLFKV